MAKRSSAGGERKRRLRKHLTQSALARRIRSSQSRVAKMETGDPTVSLDLLVQAGRHFGESGTVTLLDDAAQPVVGVDFTTSLAP